MDFPKDDSDSSETSLEERGSDSDTSLNNFLNRLYSKSVEQQTSYAKQKFSSATQTQFPNVRASFTKKVLRVSKDYSAADVVSVMAPTHVVIPRSEVSSNQLREGDPAVDSYVFIETPAVRVTLAKHPSPSRSTDNGSHGDVPQQGKPTAGTAVGGRGNGSGNDSGKAWRVQAASAGGKRASSRAAATAGAGAGRSGGKRDQGKNVATATVTGTAQRARSRTANVTGRPAWF